MTSITQPSTADGLQDASCNKPLHAAEMSGMPATNQSIALALKPRCKVDDQHPCTCFDGSTHDAPASHFPVELWSEIFLHCLPRQTYPRFRTTEAPLILGQICWAWRRLALSTPKLWSSIEVEIPHSGRTDPTEYVRLLSMMELWLQRSGNCPLSIRILYDFGPTIMTPTRSIPNPIPAKLLTALIPYARRWRRMHLLVPSVCITPLQQNMPDNFPSLQSLTLDMRGVWFSAIHLDIHTLRIDWSQLTQLHLHLDFNQLLTLDDCLDILSESASLTRCVMNVDCVFSDRHGRSPRIALPKLRHLHLILQGGAQTYIDGIRVSEVPDSCMVAFLNAVGLTNLATLGLDWLVQWDGDNRYWSESHSRFISFLRSLTPSLEELRLAYLPLVEAEVLECLVYLPRLMQLELLFSLGDKEHDPITDELIRALSLPNSFELQTSRLLPRLQSIHLQCHGARCHESSLAGLIESRWTGDLLAGVELKTFHFLSLQPVTECLSRHIKGWKDEGLDVDINSVIIR